MDEFTRSLVVLLTPILQNAGVTTMRDGSALRPPGDMAQELAGELATHKRAGAQAFVEHIHTPFGDFHERTLAREYMSERLNATEVAQWDMISIVLESQDPRRIGRGHMYKLLVKNKMEIAQARSMAESIERSVYNQVIRSSTYETTTTRSWDNPDFTQLYGARISTISINLDPDSSICKVYGTGLFQSLQKGDLKPENLGAMSAETLCPSAFRQEKEEIKERSGQKVEEKVSALWRCPGCGARSCTYREVQDRAADEPASIYCTCTVCGQNFKPA